MRRSLPTTTLPRRPIVHMGSGSTTAPTLIPGSRPHYSDTTNYYYLLAAERAKAQALAVPQHEPEHLPTVYAVDPEATRRPAPVKMVLMVLLLLLLLCLASTWELARNATSLVHPQASSQASPLPSQPRAEACPNYTVVCHPTISAVFIDQVLSAYHSPAAGTGQALYDLGVQYGIDPAFALAFFMHESTFGTSGMATTTLSLGNLRCIPNYPCIQGYAGFSSWEQGYEEWYKLIRNLYVGQWHLTTVAQIIPTYAPSSDHNNVQGYIAAVEHTIDTWHAGKVFVQ